MTATTRSARINNFGDKLGKALEVQAAKEKQEARERFLATPVAIPVATPRACACKGKLVNAVVHYPHYCADNGFSYVTP